MDLYKIVILIGIFLESIILVLAKDYYSILGVEKSADDRAIKRAFRKLAMQYHPDRNKEKDAEVKFREIAEAYEILSDPEKRRKYDQFGDGAFEGNPRGSDDFDFKEFFKNFDESFHHHQQGGKGGHFHEFHPASHQFTINLDDLWNDGGDGDGQQVPIFFHEGGVHQGGGGGPMMFDMDDMMTGESFFGGEFVQSQGSDGQRCRTVTQRVGNTVTTVTECS